MLPRSAGEGTLGDEIEVRLDRLARVPNALATMLSSAELLEHYSESLSPAEKTNLLQTIQSGAKRMSEMIDDVLTLGRAESAPCSSSNLGPTKSARALREGGVRVPHRARQEHVITLDDRFDRLEASMDDRLLRHYPEQPPVERGEILLLGEAK